MKALHLVVGLALCAPAAAAAQGLGLFDRAGGQDDAPIEIEADEGIEWRREEQQYLARGKASATRGEVSLYGEVLIAHYRARVEDGAPPQPAPEGGEDADPSPGGSEIHRIDAIGAVVIESPNERAQGERGVYDIDEGVLVLTGGDLRLTTPTDIVTARDSLEYWERRDAAVARGNAIVRRGREVVRAEVLQAFFRDGPDGQEIERVEGFTRVCVDNGRDVARGDYGRYDIDEERAVLQGNVVLTSGPNILRGDRAEMDMRTGVSRLLSDDGDGRRSRVSGIISQRRGDQQNAADQVRAKGCL